MPKAERERARARGRRAARAHRASSSASPGSCRAGSASASRWAGRSCAQPSVFLMDEPLSNLDAKLRVQMRADIAELQARLGTTTVYVTHDQAEAMTLGHRVAVLKDGRLQQCDAAARALRPAGEHVRRRIHRLAGDEPLHGAARRERPVSLGGAARRVSPRPASAPPAAAHRRARRASGPRRSSSRADGIAARVEVVEELGADAYVFCVADLPGRRGEARRPRRCGERAPSGERACACGRARPRRCSSTRSRASGSAESWRIERAFSASRRPTGIRGTIWVWLRSPSHRQRTRPGARRRSRSPARGGCGARRRARLAARQQGHRRRQ